MHRKSIVLGAISVAFGWLFTTVITSRWNSVTIVILSCLFFFLAHRILQMTQRKIYKATIVFSLLLALALVLGRQIDTEHGVFKPFASNWLLQWIIASIATFAVVINIKDLLLQYGHRIIRTEKRREGATHRQVSILAGGIIFLCWLPFFIAYYPGATSIDSHYIILQALGNAPASDAHPFTYTLLARLFLTIGNKIGGLNMGVALFTFAHVIFQTFCTAYSIGFMHQRKVKNIWLAATTLYFAASPIFASLSITLWKDIPFSLALLLYTIQLIKIIESKGELLKKPFSAAKYVLIVLLCSLLRHNGFYIAIIVSFILILYFVIKLRKKSVRIIPIVLLALVMVPMIKQIYYTSGVAKGSSVEAISIPVQQIARTVTMNGNITPEQKEKIQLFMDIDKPVIYEPFLADPAKNSVIKDYYHDHTSDFLKLWLELLPANLKHYAGAYLLITCGYWAPGIKNTIIDPRANYSGEIGVTKTQAEKWFAKTAIGRVENFDFISIGSMVWVMLFCITFILIKGQYERLLCFLPVFGLWMTLIVATPVYCSFRYIYALPLALPVMLTLALEKPIENKKKHINSETVQYLLFGGLTTLINHMVFVLWIEAFGKQQTYVAQVISFVLAASFAFVTNKQFVFQSKNWSLNIVRQEAIQFFGARVLSFGVETLGLFIAKSGLHLDEYKWFGIEALYIIKFVLSVGVVIVNYIISKSIIFNEKKRKT